MPEALTKIIVLTRELIHIYPSIVSSLLSPASFQANWSPKFLITLESNLDDILFHLDKSIIFSLPLLPKAKRSVGNKESGLEKIVVDML